MKRKPRFSHLKSANIAIANGVAANVEKLRFVNFSSSAVLKSLFRSLAIRLAERPSKPFWRVEVIGSQTFLTSISQRPLVFLVDFIGNPDP